MSESAVTGIGSMATRLLMARLASAYEHESGQKIDLQAIGGVDAARRVRAGDALDFAVLASRVIGELAQEGHVRPERLDIARCEMVAAVRAGGPHPDIGSEASLRDAVLRAERIGYSTGPSGDHLLRVLDDWGVMQSVQSRLVLAPPGMPVAELLAQRKVELGFQQMSEFVDRAQVEVVGPLPVPVQLVTVFSAALCTTARDPGAAREFLGFAMSSEAAVIKRRCGMAPAGGQRNGNP